MQLISVNIGKAESIENAKSGVKTGIFKRPVKSPVTISTLGLPGDAICDVQHHGGVDQAVYVYGMVDYAWWSAELGFELMPGAFGENLTISDVESAGYNVGDRFQIGSNADSTILEVTAPRIPCVTLGARMGDSGFVKRFRYAERPGLYCRVIQAGTVRAGDDVTVDRYDGETISILEMYRFFYEPKLDEATLRRHLAAPIAIRDREAKEEQLQALLAAQ